MSADLDLPGWPHDESRDLLQLAEAMPGPVVDKLAHALGWPDPANVHRPRSRVRWAKPYRNYWCGSAEHPDWLWAQRYGLACLRPFGPDRQGWPEWQVTPLGQAVVRLRLLAVRLANEVSNVG